MLDVTETNILLIGGGRACAEKLRSLSQIGRPIRAIAPEFCPAFDETDWIEKLHRRYEPGDLKGVGVVYVGIGDRQVEDAILEEAKREGTLVNFIDRVDASDFISPSSLIKENFSIFISTFGRAPGATKRIRRVIEEAVDLDELDRYTADYAKNRDQKKE